jgi:hypothetical protein
MKKVMMFAAAVAITVGVNAQAATTTAKPAATPAKKEAPAKKAEVKKTEAKKTEAPAKK